jgi:ketopantoate reductase
MSKTTPTPQRFITANAAADLEELTTKAYNLVQSLKQLKSHVLPNSVLVNLQNVDNYFEARKIDDNE